MRAIVAASHGGPEVLEIKEVPKPTPGIGEVLVKVEAASVNPFDTQVRRGDYAEYVRAPFKLGVDVSGTVEAIEEGVETLAVGDDVFYSTRVLSNEGGYAEYHVEQAQLLAKKPVGMSFVDANRSQHRLGLPHRTRSLESGRSRADSRRFRWRWSLCFANRDACWCRSRIDQSKRCTRTRPKLGRR